MRNRNLYKKYKQDHNVCEKCGSEDGIEVHHKIPLIEGGSDTEDNFISLCYECHKKEHELNRSELTKRGIEKARAKEIKDVLISKIALLQTIQNEELYSVAEIIDCIIEAPIKKTIRC